MADHKLEQARDEWNEVPAEIKDRVDDLFDQAFDKGHELEEDDCRR